MAVNEFDRIAPFYDTLSHLTFGRKILESQTYFLNHIKKDDHLLIIGGGTGKMLSVLPESVKIDYLEKSKKMIKLASRKKEHNAINFIHKDFCKFHTLHRYNVVICPFFLDCFDGVHLQRVISIIKNMTKENGKLIVTDFEKDHMSWTLSKLMHTFFKLFSNLESRELKPIHQFIINEGFQVVEEKNFHQKMIFSRVYRNL